MSADTLTIPSRDFYEYAKMKVAASLCFAATSVALLGLCSEYGGLSDFNGQIGETDGLSGDMEDAYNALKDSYGFGSFCAFAGFAIFLSAAIYISALVCGSLNEKRTLKTPFEIDMVYPEYGNTAAKSDSNHGYGNNQGGYENPPVAQPVPVGGTFQASASEPQFKNEV